MWGADLLFHFHSLDFWVLLCTLNGIKDEDPPLPVSLYGHIYSKYIHSNVCFFRVLCCQFINISAAGVFIATVMWSGVLHMIKYRGNNYFSKIMYSANLLSFQGTCPSPGLVFVPSLFLSTSEPVEGPVKHLPETKHFLLMFLVLFFWWRLYTEG